LIPDRPGLRSRLWRFTRCSRTYALAVGAATLWLATGALATEADTANRIAESAAGELDCTGIPSGATIIGTERPDVLVGTEGDDVIAGLGGDDEIWGRGGNDRICGGRGSDRIAGDDGDDTVDGGPDNDGLGGGVGDDRVYGRQGNDAIAGGPGDDLMDGGPPGGGVLWRFPPRDFCVFEAVVVADLGSGRATGEGDDTLVECENLIAHATGSTLVGDDERNLLWDESPAGPSGEGSVLEGRNGPDWLIGGDGDDHLDAGEDSDQVEGGEGDDIVLGGGGDNDMLEGGPGDDTMDGGDGNGDTLHGGRGNDRLDGGAGDSDFVKGEAGDDTMDGGDGAGDGCGFDAVVRASLESGQATGQGNDTLARCESLASIMGSTLVGDAGDNHLSVAGGLRPTPPFPGSRLEGGAGDDVLSGGYGDDDLDGGTGDDLLGGGSGNDHLLGGADEDVLSGGRHDDLLDGGPGVSDTASYLYARPVRVNLQRGTGESLGSPDDPRGSGEDEITQVEDVQGSAFADTLIGDAGPNALYGNEGNDTIDGRAGNDALLGGDGTDRLAGGAGTDECLDAESRSGCELAGQRGLAEAGTVRTSAQDTAAAPTAGAARLSFTPGRATCSREATTYVLTVKPPLAVEPVPGAGDPQNAIWTARLLRQSRPVGREAFARSRISGPGSPRWEDIAGQHVREQTWTVAARGSYRVDQVVQWIQAARRLASPVIFYDEARNAKQRSCPARG
jgi:Ca2+-binding RTX toxin-like protein